VPVTGGLFSVILGSAIPLPDSVFNGEDRYLGISINGGEEIDPRTQLTSAPGAAVSRRVAGDIHTGPGKLLVANSAGDSAVVLMAVGETHVIRLHPPDPCVPPDPCEPALELVAEPDTHILRVHPPEPCVPPEPCIPAFEVIADAEIHSVKIHPPDPCAEPPCAAAAIILAGADGAKVGIGTDTPTDALEVIGTAEVEGFRMPTDAADGHVLTSDADGNGTWQSPAGTAGHAENVNNSTDATGNVNVTYPAGLFSATPSLSVTAQFNSGGIAQMGWVTVSNHTASGFTLNVKDGNGTNWTGAVQISYTAIGQ
jgi:hypothetical protein